MTRPAPHTAALLLIGNEILSGKIRDENGSWLLRELRELGVDTRRVEVVPDEPDLIVDAFHRCRAAARHVFTSGGIGTTHDDVTVPSIAGALGREVRHHPDIVAMLELRYGAPLDEFRVRLAELPDGGELLWGDGAKRLRFPAIYVADDAPADGSDRGGVMILPGVPSLFVEKFEALKERFRAPPIKLVNLYLGVGEGEIARTLTDATRRFPQLAIGSYPRFDDADHKVKVTIESRDAALVDACAGWLREALGRVVLRVE